MNQEEFDKARVELSQNFESMLIETCQKFEEEFMNWNKLQEEFSDEYDCEIFLQEIIDGVLENIVESGGILL